MYNLIFNLSFATLLRFDNLALVLGHSFGLSLFPGSSLQIIITPNNLPAKISRFSPLIANLELFFSIIRFAFLFLRIERAPYNQCVRSMCVDRQFHRNRFTRGSQAVTTLGLRRVAAFFVLLPII